MIIRDDINEWLVVIVMIYNKIFLCFFFFFLLIEEILKLPWLEHKSCTIRTTKEYRTG